MKLRLFALCILFLSAVLMVSCSLAVQDIAASGATSRPTVDPQLEQLIQNQLNATPLPKPSVETVGFFFLETDAPAGFDPLYAVCGSSALELTRDGKGWKAEKVGMDLVESLKLDGTGQTSDFNKYVYVPSIAEIYYLDDAGYPNKVISFKGELYPEYWIWAWNSLMFIKNCNMTVYSVGVDGKHLHQRFKF
jgi:hypothetical protein